MASVIRPLQLNLSDAFIGTRSMFDFGTNPS